MIGKTKIRQGYYLRLNEAGHAFERGEYATARLALSGALALAGHMDALNVRTLALEAAASVEMARRARE